jgi:aminoglycoside phosphotransferase (APT) family kinase protein
MTREELDPQAILAALDHPDAIVRERVQGGRDTALWRVEQEDTTYALRVFRPEQAPVSHREVVVMDAAAQAGIPVPRVHAEGVWCSRPALLLSWCPGKTLEAELFSHPWRIGRLGRAFGRTLAQIHAVPAPEALHASSLDWIASLGTEEQALQSRLRAAVLPASSLLHLDYHPRNVLTDGTNITAVLDWANVLAGDPRADLARTLVILQFAAIEHPYHPIIRFAVPWLSRHFLHGYCQIAGPQNDLPLFLAWAWAMTYQDMAAKPPEPGLRPTQTALEHMKVEISRWKSRAQISA